MNIFHRFLSFVLNGRPKCFLAERKTMCLTYQSIVHSLMNLCLAFSRFSSRSIFCLFFLFCSVSDWPKNVWNVLKTNSFHWSLNHISGMCHIVSDADTVQLRAILSNFKTKILRFVASDQLSSRINTEKKRQNMQKRKFLFWQKVYYFARWKFLLLFSFAVIFFHISLGRWVSLILRSLNCLFRHHTISLTIRPNDALFSLTFFSVLISMILFFFLFLIVDSNEACICTFMLPDGFTFSSVFYFSASC